MNTQSFSFLYPDKSKITKNNQTAFSEEMLYELNIGEFLETDGQSVCNFITDDKNVIEYRNAVFSDMIKSPSIYNFFDELLPILRDIYELRTIDDGNDDTSSYLSSIIEIELYISAVDLMNEYLCQNKCNFVSMPFIELSKEIKELKNSDYYKNLNQKLKELTDRVREIKSVTIGVNLDSSLRPKDAGVISINPEKFKSGDTLDKILRLDFKADKNTCIANLIPFNSKNNENEKTALTNAFYSAINKVFKSSLHSWKKIINDYLFEKVDFLINLIPEIDFLRNGYNFINALSKKGYKLTFPIISSKEFEFEANGLFNPTVALKIDDEIVKNDLAFDDKARIYILTGPNRGGKSVITTALGSAVVMAQLGLPVPADKMTFYPFDAIFTHFPSSADDTLQKGRLGEECERLSTIIKSSTKNSLVLLDESLSSTGSYEASYIASEILCGLSLIGCRTLFSTHLHELASKVEEINKKVSSIGGAPIDTLVAGIEEGKRSFEIIRKKPDGKSYAFDIAEKYGLSFENIKKNIKK